MPRSSIPSALTFAPPPSALNIFIIHFLGDVPSPTMMGWVADRHSLQIAFILPLSPWRFLLPSCFTACALLPPVAVERNPAPHRSTPDDLFPLDRRHSAGCDLALSRDGYISRRTHSGEHYAAASGTAILQPRQEIRASPSLFPRATKKPLSNRLFPNCSPSTTTTTKSSSVNDRSTDRTGEDHGPSRRVI